MTTGLSIREIQNKVRNGAEINDDGTIVTVSEKTLSPASNKPEEVSEIKTKAASTARAEGPSNVEVISKSKAQAETSEHDTTNFIIFGTSCFILIAAISVSLIVITKSRKQTEKAESEK